MDQIPEAGAWVRGSDTGQGQEAVDSSILQARKQMYCGKQKLDSYE